MASPYLRAFVQLYLFHVYWCDHAVNLTLERIHKTSIMMWDAKNPNL